jgi:hypothetical protein
MVGAIAASGRDLSAKSLPFGTTRIISSLVCHGRLQSVDFHEGQGYDSTREFLFVRYKVSRICIEQNALIAGIVHNRGFQIF